MLPKLISIRFVRFLGVGGLNTLFGFAVYSLLELPLEFRLSVGTDLIAGGEAM